MTSSVLSEGSFSGARVLLTCVYAGRPGRLTHCADDALVRGDPPPCAQRALATYGSIISTIGAPFLAPGGL